VKRIAAIAAGAIALMLPATAQAWTSNHFYSPSSNIECKYYGNNGSPFVACMTFNDGYIVTVGQYGKTTHYWNDNSWGFSRYSSHYVLDYGQNWTTGVGLRCHSSTAGMKCWSTYSGHGFLLSRATISRW
jgi:hypothetical protein